MDVGQIAKRYATALFEYSIFKQSEDAVYRDVQFLLNRYLKDPESIKLLDGRSIDNSLKISILKHFGESGVSEAMSDFIDLLIKHHREKYLYFILVSFRKLYKKHNNIMDAELIMAYQPDDSLLEHLREVSCKSTGCNVVIHTEVRPEILGGFIFRIEDMRLDASVMSQIKNLINAFGYKKTRII